ncbi:DUF6801 domain-containing protein [Nocardioides sp.]|uniref:DUF6801 domain-containing protein n=1 Tax=Nocardioides sp. TaxID=35761 RepID=UPI0039E690E1
MPRTRRHPRSLLAGAFAAALTAPLVALAPAHAEQVVKQASYTCQIAGVPGESTVGILLRVELPESLTPGQKVSIKGRITLRLPENVKAAADAAELTHVQGYSDTVTLPVTIGGKTTLVRTSRIQTPKVAIGKPFTVSAPLSVPAFTIPDDASGDVVIELPRNGTVANPKDGGSPAKVAFTAMSTVYGEGGSQSIGLFCYYKTDIDRVIARIPVAATSATTPAATASATSSATSSASATAVPTDAGSTGPAPDGASAPVATVTVTAAASPEPTLDPTVEAFRASAADDPDRDGVFVPEQALIAAGVGVLALALLYAFLANRRLRLLGRRSREP